jgi:hypothetical protein
MTEINAEFQRGNDLNAYRGVPWWTDDGQSGAFSAGQISMWEFYGKRVSSPIPNGVRSVQFLGKFTNAQMVAGIPIGDDDPDRFIVVCGGQWDGGTGNGQVATHITLNGVQYPIQEANGQVTNLGQLETNSSKNYMHGIRVPSGPTLTVQCQKADGANIGYARHSAYRIICKNAGLIKRTPTSRTDPEGQVRAGLMGPLPAGAVIIGVGHPDAKQNDMTWSANITRDCEEDMGNWRYSSANTVLPGAADVTITADNGPNNVCAYNTV